MPKKKVAFVKISKKQGGKGIPSHFIWSKNADAVVKEYRRKSGRKSEIMITVLTWFTERFLWSCCSVTGAISSFDSFYLNVFLFASLTLAFYRAHTLWLTLVLKTFNWPDIEGANDMYGNTVHHHLRMLRLTMCVCVCVPTAVFILTISKALSTVALDTCQLKKNNPFDGYHLRVRAHSGSPS